MTLLTRHQEVRLLAEHLLDTARPEGAGSRQRGGHRQEHLALEEVEAFDTDHDIWRLWKEETEAAVPGDINAGVLKRALEHIGSVTEIRIRRASAIGHMTRQVTPVAPELQGAATAAAAHPGGSHSVRLTIEKPGRPSREW